MNEINNKIAFLNRYRNGTDKRIKILERFRDYLYKKEKFEITFFKDRYNKPIKQGSLVLAIISGKLEECIILGPTSCGNIFYLQLSWHGKKRIKDIKQYVRFYDFFINIDPNRFISINENQLSDNGKIYLNKLLRNDLIKRIYYGRI